MARRFSRVPKTAKGTPKKYVRGATNRTATENEIRSTARKYKQGTLTKAEMDAIAKRRSRNAKKR